MPEICNLDRGIEDVQHAPPREAQEDGADGDVDVAHDRSRLVCHVWSVFLRLLYDVVCEPRCITDQYVVKLEV